jgi:hypothetical protein
MDIEAALDPTRLKCLACGSPFSDSWYSVDAPEDSPDDLDLYFCDQCGYIMGGSDVQLEHLTPSERQQVAMLSAADSIREWHDCIVARLIG